MSEYADILEFYQVQHDLWARLWRELMDSGKTEDSEIAYNQSILYLDKASKIEERIRKNEHDTNG